MKRMKNKIFETSRSCSHILSNKSKMTKGQVKCSRAECDLGITLNGGQSFRWVALEDGKSYRGVFAGRVWTLNQDDNNIIYTVHEKLQDTNYEKIVSNYFRFDISLKENLEKWSVVDKNVQKALESVGGVRILNQDIVENLFAFICSSNNNIIRISSMVEKLCRFFGKKLCDLDGKEYYNFPKIETLATKKVESILKTEGFGYRAAYIVKTAQKLKELGGRTWLSSLHKDNNSSYEFAKENLESLPGVGPKVADCVCLMSLGHLEAIPVDTHIYQVAAANYMPNLKKVKSVTPKIHREVSDHLRELWGPLAGWAQAIVFCAKINNNQSSQKVNGKKRKSDSSVNEKVGSKKKT
ncbi:N-glycosylase/DNA lyase [Belonocnema kinseyi]|uniref:N-glycosylase/DNA lyase n=1 Tax=Belonocnema kinseyi TaxID=2817044 RepID=UPI00143D2305|nr:N-glycosylase/DNA lyase [Belonocnema kinseyi]